MKTFPVWMRLLAGLDLAPAQEWQCDGPVYVAEELLKKWVR